jgi:hypothetical protein
MKCTYVFTQSARYFYPTVTTFGISRQIFITIAIPSSGSRVAQADRRTDRLTAWYHFSRFNVVGNNKTYLSFHVTYPILLPDFNQTWIFSTDFHGSPQYQISRKSVQWKPGWYVWTDGRTNRDGLEEDNRGLSRQCEGNWRYSSTQ